METDSNQAIACALTAAGYQERIEDTKALSRDALLVHQRRGLVLELTYAAEAVERVREFVRRERHGDAPCTDLREGFRRADWIDVTRGLRSFGVSRSFVARLFATWPSAGFHWRLVTLTLDRFQHHPLTPLPMIRL